MSDLKENKKAKKESVKSLLRSFFITLVIAIIIVAFIFTGGPMLGINDFIRDVGKTKIKNENGTITIPADAQVEQNRNNPNAYVGKILNQKIQLGKRDEFNINLSRVFSSNADPFTKYQYARFYFDQSLNKIIGMKKAREMDLIISKDLLIKEVGKRYFPDSDGEPDYLTMRKNANKVTEFAKENQENMLFENFENDTFYGLPLTKDEILDKYKIDNTKISVKFVSVSNKEVDEEKVKQFYDANKDNYKMYKLTRLVFKDKKEAEKALKDINNDTKKFTELGNELKSEDKVVNIVYDNLFSFIDKFENDDLKKAAKITNKGNICQSVINTTVGPIIFKVEDVDSGDYTNEKVRQKAKTDYTTKNTKEIDSNINNIAMNIYNEAKQIGFDKSIEKNKIKSQTTSNSVSFLGHGLPYANPDATDDINHFVKLFKADKGDIIEPFKSEYSYIIATVIDKIEGKIQNFDSLYDGLYKSYSKEKSTNISRDFYNKERKKYEVVDNFNYVFKIQDFMPKQEK